MLDILMYAGIALAIAVAAVLAYVATKPDDFRITRSATIDAPAEHIFPLIANLKSMNTWNPFVAPDPDIKIVYTGPDAGKGAFHTWSGNRHVGEGSIEITDAVPNSNVQMRLRMLKPMKADNNVEFSLIPNGKATTVTWAMTGALPFVGKLMNVFINCDKMCGDQFEKGLASLKSIAEGRRTDARAPRAATAR